MKDKANKLEIMRMLLAVSISFFIIIIIVFLVSKEPIEALKSFLLGPLKSIRRMGNVIELMIPLMFSGLATIFLFRTGLFNLSAEGAIFFGAVIATVVGLFNNLHPILSLIIAMIFAGVFGGIITMIPGFLKLKYNANEIVTSLMINFVCLNIGLYIINEFFLDHTINSKYSLKFNQKILLPKIVPKTRIHVGILVIVIMIVFAWFILNRTKFGLKSKIVGSNSRMAKYVGINTFSIVIMTQFMGGFISGLGGAVELFGMYTRFQYTGLTGYGWDGIPIAIIAKHNPKYVPFAALFFSYLKIGADIMARENNIPFEIIQIVQAVMIVFISAQILLSGYKRKTMIKKMKETDGEVNV